MLSSLLLAFLTGSLIQGESPTAPAAGDLEPFVGTFELTLERPLEWNGVQTIQLGLRPMEGGLTGGARYGEGTALVEGQVTAEDARGGHLALEIFWDDGSSGCTLERDADGGYGGELFGMSYRARRTSPECARELALEVDFGVERPVTVERAELPEFLAEVLLPLLTEFVERERIVGASFATVLDHELVDLRGIGWQDFAARVPATARTRYRWASISKPVTAVAALQLVEKGRLNLDADVRELVPEWPEKRWKVTARNLLRHQAGVVHYQHGPIVTARTYDDPDPFRDRILALDKFRESPLLFEPGTVHSYSTHAYALLGAVVERAGGERFCDQVQARIARPLGMTSFGPDFHQSEDIPDQTKGYVAVLPERTIDSGDSNVAWKLAGGGFLSTVGDLARFGIGLMDDSLLEDETRELMFTNQTTKSGATTGYGLGVSVQTIAGYRAIGHGGSQRKARTFLLVVPELGLGFAVMTNTEGADVQRLAGAVLRELTK